MATMPDPIQSARLVTREVRNGTRGGEPTKIILARRTYRAERADVWDALTDAERLPRWFLPVSGDLAVGGRYQFEGNAGGLVEACDAPERLAVTWEFEGQISWLAVHLRESGETTELELVHEAPIDPEMWRRFGPGAGGLGWDGALMGFGVHLETGETATSEEHEAWSTGPEGIAFFREAGEDWARAASDAGDEPEQARAAAEGAIAFYTTPPEEAGAH